jgi:L-alanine-DL-glutamate epimerase-like enolase superfamily enzyme
MRITAIETYPVRIPLKPARRMISALGQHVESHFLIVRVLTDAGIEGVGEATVTPRWSGETVWTAKSMVEQILAPAVIGLDPNDIVGLDRQMDRCCIHNWFAKSAIEMACWDIQGKAAGKPVYELLGGACRPLSIRCRFSMGAYPPAQARKRAEELVQEGFTTFKVKVGTIPAEDIERVRIVREVAGPNPDLVIDANCGWDAATAIAAVKELDDCNVGLFEQPTPDGDYAAIAEVRRAIKPLVMADDMCFNLIHAKELVRNAGCDVISVYPGKNGGIRKSKEIVEFSATHGIACSIGSNLEWDIGTAAMCHLAVACPNLQLERFPGDILGPDYHEFSIARNPIAIQGPIVTITDRPGLGVDVDWELVRKNVLR